MRRKSKLNRPDGARTNVPDVIRYFEARKRKCQFANPGRKLGIASSIRSRPLLSFIALILEVQHARSFSLLLFRFSLSKAVSREIYETSTETKVLLRQITAFVTLDDDRKPYWTMQKYFKDDRECSERYIDCLLNFCVGLSFKIVFLWKLLLFNKFIKLI